MFLKMEHIEADIANLEAQLRSAEEAVARTAGAIAYAKGIKEFLKREEPKEEKIDISPENAAIQERDKAAIQQLAAQTENVHEGYAEMLMKEDEEHGSNS